MAKNDVIVQITQEQVSGSTGFGVPLIIQGKAVSAKAYGEHRTLEEVEKAGHGKESLIYQQCEKLFLQDGHPEKVAVCAGLGKISETLAGLKEKDFRQIIPIFGEEDDTPAELAAYVESTEDKMLVLKVADVSALSGITRGDRTIAIVYSGADSGVEAAFVGATAGMTVGSYTYKNIIIKGIAPDAITDAQIEAVHAAGGICIVKKAGDTVTSEGKVTGGEYIDVIDGRDYIVRNIAYRAQKLLNTVPRLTYNNVGISQLEGVVTNVLAEAYGMGIVASGDDGSPMYATNFATRSEVGEEDRKQRTYNGGKFSYSPAGAVHYATINGLLKI